MTYTCSSLGKSNSWPCDHPVHNCNTLFVHHPLIPLLSCSVCYWLVARRWPRAEQIQKDGPPTGLTPNQPSRLFLNREAHSTQCISGSFLVSIGSVLPIHVHSPSFPFHLAPQLGSLLLYRKVIPAQCLVVPYQSAVLHYQTSHQGLHRSLVGVFRSLIRVLSCSLKFPFSFQYPASGLSRLFSSCCC